MRSSELNTNYHQFCSTFLDFKNDISKLIDNQNYKSKFFPYYQKMNYQMQEIISDSLSHFKKISEEQKIYEIKPKIFIQINIGGESQKSGISVENLLDFFHECKKLDLNIIGTMCLPPIDKDPEIFFSHMSKINNDLKLKELSMGMSEDYLKAIKYYSTYLRVGSKIFGPRS